MRRCRGLYFNRTVVIANDKFDLSPEDPALAIDLFDRKLKTIQDILRIRQRRPGYVSTIPTLIGEAPKDGSATPMIKHTVAAIREKFFMACPRQIVFGVQRISQRGIFGKIICGIRCHKA